ncbi:hypothetical protein KC963_01920 [Candidatus Saccharibacteria bacterium]|nr:hypothetical protein [Candidatus Saccharibacteria bacterium]
MSPEAIIALIGAGVVALTIVVIVLKFALRRAPLKPKKKSFVAKWKELQAYCKDKTTWPQALESADKLLDRALVKRGFKGQSMGERLTNAQKVLTDNESVWIAHKLAKKVHEDPATRLRENDVKQALVAIGQALQDLGALPKSSERTNG